MNLYDDLKYRGLIGQTAGDDIEEALNSGKLKFYIGVDPTGKSIHAGNLLAILNAKRIASYGHKPYILIGGATGLIGDPSGKSQERNLQTVEAVLENAKGIRATIEKVIPEATFVNNYDWTSQMNVITFLRDYGKNLTVNYMMSKESVKKRLENGISFTEFSYQLLQAMDYYHLYTTEGVNLQVGGQDQWGNITSGFELIRKMSGEDAKAYCLTFPLLLKPDGTKFGKTAGGAVWLDPNMTSPYAFYQFWLNTSDEEVIDRLKEFTFLSKEEIEAIEAEWVNQKETRLAQKRLAEEVTRLVHGEKALEEAKGITKAVFSGDVASLSSSQIEEAFKDDKVTVVNGDINVVDALVLAGLAPSKSEGRKLVQGGAVSVNSVKITDFTQMLTKENAIDGVYSFIKKGKKNHALLKHEA